MPDPLTVDQNFRFQVPPRILIADDQQDVITALRLLFKGEGYAVETCSSPREALAAIGKRQFDVLLFDLNYTRDTTSGKEGLGLIREIRKYESELPIVVMSAWATVDLAVECMRQGACDFVQKPWENARIISIVRTQAKLYRNCCRRYVLEDENRILRGQSGVDLLARSEAMKPVLDIIENVGPSEANILITGENGSGKGVVAKALHNRSARREKSFVSVNMGGLPEGVFESEMFGHVKGAFTDAKTDRSGRFEMADGGTLFMDEIANIPMTQQNKLLRLLESGEYERVGSSRPRKVDVRLISATNADLEKEVREGKFRQDLLYRLNTIHTHIPPLRERPEDIPLLAAWFLERHKNHYGREFDGLADSASEIMLSYSWPGNVRELDHAIERAVLLARGRQIQPRDLGLQPSKGDGPSNLDEMNLEEVESYLIKRTLLRNHGNATKAARDLGLSRSAFYRRLQRFGL